MNRTEYLGRGQCNGINALVPANQSAGKPIIGSRHIITRRILDILYSAQHGNQHKDAFAWI